MNEKRNDGLFIEALHGKKSYEPGPLDSDVAATNPALLDGGAGAAGALPKRPRGGVPGNKGGPGGYRPGSGRPRLNLSKPSAQPADPGNGSAGAILTPLWTTENARPIGQLPFLVAGVATGYEGWTLEPKEAQAIAESLAQVLNALAPAGGKYAAITALSSTLLVIGGMKFKGYREYLAARQKDIAGDKPK